MKSDKFLVDQLSPIALFYQLTSLFPGEKAFLFESGIQNDDGNFSFIFIGEREGIEFKGGILTYRNGVQELEIEEEPFQFLQNYYSKVDSSIYRELKQELGVGFIDGFVGYVGFDIVPYFEPILKPVFSQLEDRTSIPDLHLIRPKLVGVYSHRDSTFTLLLHSPDFYPYLSEIKELLSTPYTPHPLRRAYLEGEGEFQFSKGEFCQLVEKGKEHIRRGDVFQLVLSNRLTISGKVDKFTFYRLLRSKNPSPYLYHMDFGEFAIVGSSPEIMVKLDEGEILLRPIAGTRKRGKNLQRDLELERELRGDIKEQAEHLMLVDLGRNDVGRVAKKGSVRVTDFMRVERYSHVMHLVSDVVGELREDLTQFDLFKATFPAGTVTGAPKIKAMELIARYEKVKRSFYSGAVGYFGFDGNMDTAIAIRTALWKPDSLIFQAGAGIVADSIPELEFKEINNKLGALRATLQTLTSPQLPG
jgi:anthranilate synthase component 1